MGGKQSKKRDSKTENNQGVLSFRGNSKNSNHAKFIYDPLVPTFVNLLPKEVKFYIVKVCHSYRFIAVTLSFSSCHSGIWSS